MKQTNKQKRGLLFPPTPLAVTWSPVSLTTLPIYIRSAISIPSHRHQSTPAEQGVVSNRLWQRHFYRGGNFASVSLGVLIIYVPQFTCLAASFHGKEQIIGLRVRDVRCLWAFPLKHYKLLNNFHENLLKQHTTTDHFKLVHFNFLYWQTTRPSGEAGS